MSLEDPDAADVAAKAIMRALNRRGGYDDLWDEIPPDLRNEILEEIASGIRNTRAGGVTC